MRIISGKFKGRKLVSFNASHIRPTTDRVKETLFNKLMGQVPDARVLDLFAGTGNLGIEALSRDAASVQFVESSEKSLVILRKNLDLLGLKSGFTVTKQDVFTFLKKNSENQYEIIFADPPFTEKIAHKVMTAIGDSCVLAPGGVVVIESSRHERIDDCYGNLKLLDRRNFGDKDMSFFTEDQSQ